MACHCNKDTGYICLLHDPHSCRADMARAIYEPIIEAGKPVRDEHNEIMAAVPALADLLAVEFP